MAITVDWGDRAIHVPKDYLTPLGGVLYGLNVDTFRLALKNLEDDEDGMVFPDTHRHSLPLTLAGVIYARGVEIINGYTVEFEDGQYTVVCSGANHNLSDVRVPNSVSLVIGNAAGLIQVETGVSGLTESESDRLMALPVSGEIADAVRIELEPELSEIDITKAFIANRLRINKETGDWTVYDDTGSIPLYTGTISDDGTFKDRVPA